MNKFLNDTSSASAIARLLSEENTWNLDKIKKMLEFLKDRHEPYGCCELTPDIVPDNLKPQDPVWDDWRSERASFEHSVLLRIEHDGVIYNQIEYSIIIRDYWGDHISGAPHVYVNIPINAEIVRRAEIELYEVCKTSFEKEFVEIEEVERQAKKDRYLTRVLRGESVDDIKSNIPSGFHT